MNTDTHYCPRCAAAMRSFQDGHQTGWVCPACGEIVCRRTPKGYCLGIAAAVILVGLLIFLFASSIIPLLTGLGLWLVLIVFLLVVASVPLYVIYWLIKNKTTPERRVLARVLRRRSREWEVDVPKNLGSPLHVTVANRICDIMGIDRGVVLAQWSDYFITFETDKGEMELAVPEELYIELEEGEQGLLVYQGEIFRHFIKGYVK